jgi:hypothetical protein
MEGRDKRIQNQQTSKYLFNYFNFPLRFNIAIFIKIIFPTASLNIE